MLKSELSILVILEMLSILYEIKVKLSYIYDTDAKPQYDVM